MTTPPAPDALAALKLVNELHELKAEARRIRSRITGGGMSHALMGRIIDALDAVPAALTRDQGEVAAQQPACELCGSMRANIHTADCPITLAAPTADQPAGEPLTQEWCDWLYLDANGHWKDDVPKWARELCDKWRCLPSNPAIGMEAAKREIAALRAAPAAPPKPAGEPTAVLNEIAQDLLIMAEDRESLEARGVIADCVRRAWDAGFAEADRLYFRPAGATAAPPREPTEAMIAAGMWAQRESRVLSNLKDPPIMIWRAMYDAASAPAGGEGKEME